MSESYGLGGWVDLIIDMNVGCQQKAKSVVRHYQMGLYKIPPNAVLFVKVDHECEEGAGWAGRGCHTSLPQHWTGLLPTASVSSPPVYKEGCRLELVWFYAPSYA